MPGNDPTAGTIVNNNFLLMFYMFTNVKLTIVC